MSINVLFGLRAAPPPGLPEVVGGGGSFSVGNLEPSQIKFQQKKNLNHGKSSQLFVSTLFPPPCRRTAVGVIPLSLKFALNFLIYFLQLEKKSQNNKNVKK